MGDFGGRLRQARERRGISLRQIAASTKISVAALEALERNDVSRLPGGIFSRAFVRSYAHEVGLNPDETVSEFVEQFEQRSAEAAEELPKTVLSDDESQFESQQRMAGVVLRLGLISVPLIGVILYFTLRARPAPVAPMETPAPPAAAAPPREIVQPVADTGQPSGSGLTPSVSSLPAGARAAEAETVVDLHPTASCWVSATVDGRRVIAKVMQAGDRERLVVSREAVVEVGDAGAFAYSVDGREGPPLGTAGQVRTLRITPSSSR